MYQEALPHSNDLSPWLPHHRLTHIFRLVSRANARINGAVESHIEESNGQIDSWTMVRRVDVIEHKIVVNGLSERRASALRDELRGVDGNLKAHLEHLLQMQIDGA